MMTVEERQRIKRAHQLRPGTIERAERWIIVETLQITRGNITLTAKLIGWHRGRLLRWLKRVQA